MGNEELVLNEAEAAVVSMAMIYWIAHRKTRGTEMEKVAMQLVQEAEEIVDELPGFMEGLESLNKKVEALNGKLLRRVIRRTPERAKELEREMRKVKDRVEIATLLDETKEQEN